MINCPVCSFTMTQYADDDKNSILNYIEVCHMCGSIWIDGNNIAKILLLPNLPDNIEIKKIFRSKDALVKEGERICPKCYGQLYVINQMGIPVDQCKICKGILFDRSELKKVWTKNKELMHDLGNSKKKTAPKSDEKKNQTKKVITEKPTLKTKENKPSTTSIDNNLAKVLKWFDEQIGESSK